MEKQQEKIRKFSKILYRVLSIVFVMAIVIVAAEVFFGVAIALAPEQPYLLQIDDMKILAPVWMTDNAIWGIFSFESVEVAIGDIIQSIVTLVALAYTKTVFCLLKDNGTPFRDEVVKAFKHLAITLIVLGMVSGLIGLIAAAIVGVLCLIFNYGCTLQHESDTTL